MIEVLDLIRKSVLKKDTFTEKCQVIVEKLRNFFLHYNWVGIYKLEDNNLKLLTYSGDFDTEHKIIPVEKGVCGKAVRVRETIIVSDVSKSSEYLCCSLKTKSEIVVPIGRRDSIIGVIDIDGYKLDSFSQTDKLLLEEVADIIYREYLKGKKEGDENVVKIRVSYKDTDKMGVVHHANYIEYCERARVEIIRRSGLTYKQIEEMGTLLVVGEVDMKILKSAYYDDLLYVKVYIVELTPINVKFEYDIFNDKNELIVICFTNLYPQDSITRKLKRLDNFIIEKLSSVM